MRIGAFRTFDIETLKESLDSAGVKYTVFLDHELEQRILKAYHERANVAIKSSAGRLDLAYIYLDLSEGEYAKAREIFAKYGVAHLSDGSFELGEDEN